MLSSDFDGFHCESRCARLLYVSTIGSHDIELTKLRQSSHYESGLKTGPGVEGKLGILGFCAQIFIPPHYVNVIIVKTL